MHTTLSKNSAVAISPVSAFMRPPPKAARAVGALSPLGAVAAHQAGFSSHPYSEDVVLSHGGFRQTRTLGQNLASLAGASGIAVLIPVAILILGIPIALAARGAFEAVGWLAAWLLK